MLKGYIFILLLLALLGCSKESTSQAAKPNEEGDNLNKAYQAYNDGDLVLAKTLFEAELAKKKSVPEVTLGLARVAIDQEDLNNANKYIDMFFSSKDSKPDWTEVWALLTASKLAYFTGEKSKALELLSKAKERGKPKGAMDDVKVWEYRINGYENVKKVLNQTTQTPHIVFYYNPNSFAAQHMDAIKHGFEKAYDNITGKLKIKYDKKITIFLYDSNEQGHKLTSRQLGFAQGFEAQCHLEFGNKRQQTFGHELTHVISYKWGQASSALFGEGLAVDLDQSGRDLYAFMRKNSSTIATLDKLTYQFFLVPSDISYPESGAFVYFILEKYGLDVLKRLYVSTDLREDWQKVTGKTLTQLEKDFISSSTAVKQYPQSEKPKDEGTGSLKEDIDDFEYPNSPYTMEEKGYIIETPDPAKKIMEYYKKQIPKKGWQITSSSVETITCKKGNKEAFIIIIQPVKEENSTISISIMEK